MGGGGGKRRGLGEGMREGLGSGGGCSDSGGCVQGVSSLLQQPGPQKFKLFKIELIYKAKKFKVPLFTI